MSSTTASRQELFTFVLTFFFFFKFFKHSFVTTTLLLLGHCDSEWKLLTNVCRESTFKTSKLLPCDPTLQHWGKEKVELFWKQKKMAQNIKPWNFCNFGNRESRKKRVSVELHSFFPPFAVRFKTTTCGFLLVQADSKYHFIMSSTFLPSSPHSSLLSCVREGRHRNSCVTVCAVWYSTAENTVQ